jgi:hypothetical protein
MEEITHITRDETSLVEIRELPNGKGGKISVWSMTMMQSPKTDKLKKGMKIEFEHRIYEVYRVTNTVGSAGNIINLALSDIGKAE